MRKINNKKGFTLIELIVVVAVLAILAVVAVPVVGDLVTKANKSVDEANLSLFQSAIETYKVTVTAEGGGNGEYPDDVEGVEKAIATFTNVKTIGDCKVDSYKYYYVFTGITTSGGDTYTEGQLLYLAADPDGTGTNIIAIN